MTPAGRHLVKLTYTEWIKIIIVLLLQVAVMIAGAWQISLTIEHRLTKIETTLESVHDQQIEMKSDIKAQRK